MGEVHYKVSRAEGPITGTDLLNAKCCAVTLPEPQDPDLPEGEWYCEDSDCVVRGCVIACKLYGERLPRMRCPACAAPLKFDRWIGQEMLVPVGGGGD